jgi:hypothetical protein
VLGVSAVVVLGGFCCDGRCLDARGFVEVVLVACCIAAVFCPIELHLLILDRTVIGSVATSETVWFEDMTTT